MFIVKCWDIKNKKEFERVFWDRKEYSKFVHKCEHSQLIKIISTIDNSKLYD